MMIKRTAAAFRFVAKTWWIVILFLIATNDFGVLSKWFNSLFYDFYASSQAAELITSAIQVFCRALLFSFLNVFVFFYVNKRAFGDVFGFRVFISRNWHKFFIVGLCYFAVLFCLDHFLEPQGVSLLFRSFDFALNVIQYYVLAFVIGTKADRQDRVLRFKNRAGSFCLFLFCLLVISQVVVVSLRMAEYCSMIWTENDILNPFFIMTQNAQATTTSGILHLIWGIVNHVFRYFSLVYICLFLAGKQEQVDLEISRRNLQKQEQQKVASQALEQYRDLLIGIEQVKEVISDRNQLELDELIPIDTCHVIAILREYQANCISESALYDWAEMIWNTDCYEFADEQRNEIEHVIDALNKFRARGEPLTSEQAAEFIHMLAIDEF